MTRALPTSVNAMLDQALPAKYVRGLRRSEYEQLVQSGAFTGEKVELLEGLIVQMSPHGPLHDGTLDLLIEAFAPLLSHARIRVQSAFAASDGSEPEPDLALVEKRDYRHEHPSEAYLIVEVADSSLERDRLVKSRIYAQSGVREYWLVNLVDSKLIVFRSPDHDGYQSVSTHDVHDTVSPEAFPELKVPLNEVFAQDR